MTQLAYVRAMIEELASEPLQASVRARTSPKVRLVVRRERDGVTVEPFVGSASVAALLGIKRKHADAIALLVALVSEVGAHARDVRVVRRAEGEPEPVVVEVHEAGLAAAIARAPCNVRVVATGR